MGFLLDIKFNCDAVVSAQPLFLRAFTVRNGEGSFFIIVSKKTQYFLTSP